MTGHHQLKVFRFTTGELHKTQGYPLPPEWKPFGAQWEAGAVNVICRKWLRADGRDVRTP